jgi:hypothetical protein
MLTTATGKPRVSGFHCRQLQKDAYKALKAFIALTDATTEEGLQTFIQYSAWAWQQPQERQCLTETVQKWKAQRPQEEVSIHSFSLD